MGFLLDSCFKFLKTFQNGVYNGLACAIVLLVVFAIVRAGRSPLWAEAYRRLRRNRIAMISLAVIVVYAAIALADSIGWQNARRRAKKHHRPRF